MATGQSVWGIDIGQCALKAIRLGFDAKKGKAVAEAFDYIEHPKILSQPDADPDELVRAALQTFMLRNDVEGVPLYVSVPGPAGLAKFVKLPPIPKKKIDDVVKFEAKQQIPFPLEDVVWDYQVVESGDDEGDFALDTQVGIFAIKRESASKYLQPFKPFKKMEVDAVQLAPLALYNFIYYDHFVQDAKELAAKAAEKPAGEAAEGGEESSEQEGADEGDTLILIDIGSDRTDVIATDGESIWLRNLPVGGNHFTRALTKEMKLT
ncbi:MAG: pilus assembly protein PilM, partial [Planctomycetia bacterium]